MSSGTILTLEQAKEIAEEFREQFLPDMILCGSIRREETEVHDIDAMTLEEATAVAEKCEAAGLEVVAGGRKKNNGVWIKFKGVVFNIYHYKPEDKGATLFALTGPKQYVIAYRMKAKKAGMLLNQYGLFKGDERVAGETEEEIYEFLGKKYKAPNLRGKKS